MSVAAADRSAGARDTPVRTIGDPDVLVTPGSPGRAPRLGGFVIHGDAAATLGRCLVDLQAVCDEVVAVDSGSTDGSADIVRSAGVRALMHSWRGYGAARAVAVRALTRCEYVCFLDSDEYGGPGWVAKVAAWRASAPQAPYYFALRRNFAWTGSAHRRLFLFRTEGTIRFIRRDAARWEDRMIVHEAPYPHAERRVWRSSPRTEIIVDHVFPVAGELANKLDQYALLWAVLAYVDKHRQHEGALTRWANGSVFKQWGQTLRYCIAHGALRGGRSGLRTAWDRARYDALKYRVLREVEGGAYPDVVAAFREQRFHDVYTLAAAARPSR